MGDTKGRKKMYIAAASAAVVVLAAVLTVALVFNGKDETYRSIRIVEMEGGVTIERDGVGNLGASVNMNLVSNDYVRTDAGAYVVLRLDDDKYVMLGEQGAMRVEADGDASSGRTAIHLENGSVLSEIQNPLGQDASYEIITPNATMSVRGTVFETRKNDDGGNIEVLVYEGTVAVAPDGLEPALYNGGEYTQFTTGDAPQFLVERDVITEERMNSQMLDRLQQIQEGGRSLDFGEVQLDEQLGQEEAAAGTQVVDNSLTRETPEPASTPVPESTGRPADAAPTATAKPSATQRPAATAAPAATEPPAATVEPPADTNDSDDEDTSWDWKPSWPTASPSHGNGQGNGQGNNSFQDWWEPANGDDNGTTPDNPNGWKVNYYIPAIAQSQEKDGAPLAVIGAQDPRFYRQAWSRDGKPLEEIIPEDAAPDGLTFVGWYTESGHKWDYDVDIPQSNLWLYSVWKDAGDEDDGDENYYYPVILRDEETEYYRCYSVKAKTALFELPVITEQAYNGYTVPERDGYLLAAWEKTNSVEEGNALWGTRTETVSGVTALRAVWLESAGNGSLVLFTTDTAENGFGDLIDICVVETGGTIPAPARSFSRGLTLPDSAEEAGVIDWKMEDTAYWQVEKATEKIYIFHAVWADANQEPDESPEESASPE